MARQPVRITGVKKLRRVLRTMPEEIRKEVQDEVTGGADQIAATMRELVPVREGGMRDAIEIKLARDRMSARIGPGVRRKRVFRKTGWRARFLEFGTRHAGRQPFVAPALRQHEDAIQRGLSKAIARALTRIRRRAARS